MSIQFDRNLKMILRSQSGIAYVNRREARTGRRDGDEINPNPGIGLPDGYIWVREGSEGERGQTAALKVRIRDDMADVPIWIANGANNNELYAIEPRIDSQTVETWGSAIASTGVPRIPAEWSRQVIEPMYYVPGRVQPSLVTTGGLWINSAPFWYNGKLLGGEYLVSSADVPTGSDEVRWCVIFISTANVMAHAVGTTYVFADKNQLPDDFIEAVTVTAGTIPVGAFTLSESQTEITLANTRFVDVREWLAPRAATFFYQNVKNNSTPMTQRAAVNFVAGNNITLAITDDAVNNETDVAISGTAPDYILIRDEKASGTGGGTFTSGAWRTRDLNTESSDTGNHASIASNQITLAAGTYEFSAKALSSSSDRVQARLQNITDTISIVGLSGNSNSVSGETHVSMVDGKFTIATSKIFELQHRCSTTGNFGLASSFGIEAYASVEFRKTL